MKTFETEKNNIPEGATHTYDYGGNKCGYYKIDDGNWFYWGWSESWCVVADNQCFYKAMPIPQTNIETSEEEGAPDNMKQSNNQSEMCKPLWATWSIGDAVTKTKGSAWTGKVVGYYQTDLTSKGYAVESSTEKGSVQIYPEAALCDFETPQQREERERKEARAGIEHLLKDRVNFNNRVLPKTISKIIYDAGYRKEG